MQGKRKVTPETVAYIRRSKLPSGVLAYKLGLSYSYIRKVRTRTRRKNG
jgi:hypothetical protein